MFIDQQAICQLCDGEALQHAGSERVAVGSPEMLHGGDEARLDPADAADRFGHRMHGCGRVRKASASQASRFQNARVGKLYPAH